MWFSFACVEERGCGVVTSARLESGRNTFRSTFFSTEKPSVKPSLIHDKEPFAGGHECKIAGRSNRRTSEKCCRDKLL